MQPDLRITRQSAICRTICLTALLGCWPMPTMAEESFAYEDIARRYTETQLAPEAVTEARMQGECLVGLKNLNFQKRDDFDPVAEWTNYRSLSLLEQFPPCTVLIMMEVARNELLEDEDD